MPGTPSRSWPPSLPGYAFSFRPQQPRLDRVAMADLFVILMTEVLGYSRFCAQGGDIGATELPGSRQRIPSTCTASI